MKPLRVRWRLTSPIATGGYPIHLDALIAYAQTELALRMAAMTGHGLEAPIRSLGDRLPLESETRDGQTVWKASALIPTETAELGHGMRFWTRKTDPFDYTDRFSKGHLMLRGVPGQLKPNALKIDTQRGLLKNGYKFYSVKQVTELEAWCIGDEEALRELLDPECGSPIQSIGARGRSGLGTIESFLLEQDPSANERWQQRVLPWPHEGAVQAEMATRPPYWDQMNKTVAYVNPAIFL